MFLFCILFNNSSFFVHCCANFRCKTLKYLSVARCESHVCFLKDFFFSSNLIWKFALESNQKNAECRSINQTFKNKDYWRNYLWILVLLLFSKKFWRNNKLYSLCATFSCDFSFEVLVSCFGDKIGCMVGIRWVLFLER